MRLGRIWKLVGGLVRLARPLNCLMFFAGTFVGGIIIDRIRAFTWPDNSDLLLASLSTLLVGAAANAINDVFDVEADAINRPTRPIPSGVVSITLARSAWVVLSIGGVVLGFLVSSAHGLISLSAVALLYLYSMRLKSTTVIGNVVVGATVAVALVYGALVFGDARPAIPAVIFAFLTNFSREVIKDVQDIPGDSVQDVRSLPLRSGARSGINLFLALVGITLVLTPLPFVLLGYGGLYLLLILVADGALLAALWSAMRREEEGFAGRASARVKTAMVFGLGALSVASVVG